jgi:predicted nuclease with TOPRIM domain
MLGFGRGRTQDELRTLRGELEDVRSDVRRLRAEWADLFEKMVRLDDRIRKRQERAEAPDPSPTPAKPDKSALWSRLKARGLANGHP